MTSFEKYIYDHLNLLRRTIQILTVVFIFCVPLLNKLGFKEIIGTFYSISVGNLDIMDPALVLQSILLNKELYFPILLAGIIPLIIALLFDKVFCGWMCPYNLLAEFADKLRRKIKPHSVKLMNKNPKPQYYWLVFGTFFTIIAVSGLPVISFISFPGMITAQAADLILFGTLGIELLAVAIVLLLEIFVQPRFWCKYACPVGATLALFRYKHTLTVKYNKYVCREACPKNLKASLICNEACPIELDPRKEGIYPYCINCGKCIDVCQNKGGKALVFTFHPEVNSKMVSPMPSPKYNKQDRRLFYGANRKEAEPS